MTAPAAPPAAAGSAPLPAPNSFFCLFAQEFPVFNENSGPQPPKTLTSAIEINAVLQALIKHNSALTLSFNKGAQRYLSYVAAADRERAILALDELVPAEANQLLLSGAPFQVETELDGIKVSWHSEQPATPSSLGNNPCYWFSFPDSMRQHQRRNAFRAAALPEQPVNLLITVANLEGRLTNLSATGCKARFAGLNTGLAVAQLHDQARLMLPDSPVELSLEVRHLTSNEASEETLAGFKFHNTSGTAQRAIERYVYHLQREARRHTNDDFF